ncbi:eukaryotic translation initiation factor 2-alpha kinase 1-like isoform X2 [Artemia franciscana]|uniref:eukaryotic translation initiation factor 2-alpha kinase 1-like isoform X2 n=1 Tax=Artemia franciscana TaxID=6661 RepID=UPI0032DBB21E
MIQETIARFDETGSSGEHGSNSKNLLIESLLEEYCLLYTKDDHLGSKLFDGLREKFESLGLLPNRSIPPNLRIKYRQHLRHFTRLVLQKTELKEASSKENALQKLQAPINIGLENAVSCPVFPSTRLENEYTDINFLARGGFGRVFRAKHVLDGNIYAIKSILIRQSKHWEMSKALREIQTLSRLHHPNVISYKHAWLEAASSELSELSLENASDVSSKQPKPPLPLECASSASLKMPTRDSSDIDIVFRHSNESSCSIENEQSLPFKTVPDKVVIPSVHLYIAMQYCEETLRDWMKRRNSSDGLIDLNVNLTIFRQVVEGVDAIHGAGIIHRDLKPENIFFNHSTCQVQIGDFGLARFLPQKAAHSTLTPISSNVCQLNRFGFTNGIGTHSYAAPEQITGGQYDQKCDIYSLGYILVELFQKWPTEFERAKCFQDLRKQIVPANVQKNWPAITELVQDLILPFPDRRPSAAELLRRLSDISRDFLEARKIGF